jgi:hypothetical protein
MVKIFTLERNPMYVSSVINASVVTLPFSTMKEFTVERNPLYVSIVEKPSTK